MGLHWNRRPRIRSGQDTLFYWRDSLISYPPLVSGSNARRPDKPGSISPRAFHIAGLAWRKCSIFTSGQIYGYFNASQTGITPANINMLAGAPSVNLAASVVTASNGLAPGLAAQPIGSSIAIDQVYPYTANGFTYYGVQVAFNLGAQTGSQHIIFSTPSYTYVLPAAINLTQSEPPTVTAASGNLDGTVTVTGTNWAPDTLLYFDGLPSSIQSRDPVAGSAVVVPPAGTNNEQAIRSAYNSGRPEFAVRAVGNAGDVDAYGAAVATPLIASITPSSLARRCSAAIDIAGSGFTFLLPAGPGPDRIMVGFGTSDVLVQQVFVACPPTAWPSRCPGFLECRLVQSGCERHGRISIRHSPRRDSRSRLRWQDCRVPSLPPVA